jgi:hypothetical protein
MSNQSEFARPVPLTRLGGEPFHQHIVADEAERAALARRFELVALDRLEAEVELVREATGTILLTASITAEFAQDPASLRLILSPAASVSAFNCATGRRKPNSTFPVG